MTELIGKTIKDVEKRHVDNDVSSWDEFKVTCSDGTVVYYKCVSLNSSEFTSALHLYKPKKLW